MSKDESHNNKAPAKRVEYRGKNIRLSRTGGLSATKTFAGDGYGVTINTQHGLRLHKRLMKGARIGFQRGNFQFIGRYSRGPFNFNISKSGLSTSIRNERGSYNFFKPNYSSFKLGCIQLRGKNAATLQLIYVSFWLLSNLFKLLWRVSSALIWLLFLTLKWLMDFIIGFYKGFRQTAA
jgi:hypothetical protein